MWLLLSNKVFLGSVCHDAKCCHFRPIVIIHSRETSYRLWVTNVSIVEGCSKSFQWVRVVWGVVQVPEIVHTPAGDLSGSHFKYIPATCWEYHDPWISQFATKASASLLSRFLAFIALFRTIIDHLYKFTVTCIIQKKIFTAVYDMIIILWTISMKNTQWKGLLKKILNSYTAFPFSFFEVFEEWNRWINKSKKLCCLTWIKKYWINRLGIIFKITTVLNLKFLLAHSYSNDINE